jgi:hypothetical protein
MEIIFCQHNESDRRQHQRRSEEKEMKCFPVLLQRKKWKIVFRLRTNYVREDNRQTDRNLFILNNNKKMSLFTIFYIVKTRKKKKPFYFLQFVKLLIMIFFCIFFLLLILSAIKNGWVYLDKFLILWNRHYWRHKVYSFVEVGTRWKTKNVDKLIYFDSI